MDFSDLTLPSTAPGPALSDKLTLEQRACTDFINNASGNLVIDSVAGSGKSTVLVEQCVTINHYFPTASIALVMFNAKNVPEIELKCQRRGVLKTTIGTVHKFAFAAYKAKHGHTVPNKTKLTSLASKLNNTGPKMPYQDLTNVNKLVDLAKNTGLCLEGTMDRDTWFALAEAYDIEFKEVSDSDAINLAHQLLYETLDDESSVDFSDMIAIPLYHNYPFRQYDFVLVDEAQDINASRLEAVRRMLKPTRKGECNNCDGLGCKACKKTGEYTIPGGRLIAVGDRHQAIYGFTGADENSLTRIQQEFNAKELKLTTCFRCAKSIIKSVNHLVPHIRPRSDAPDGIVQDMRYEDFEKFLLSKDNFETVSRHAILCRKNAPLMNLAFKLSSRGLRCRMEGKDIGRTLVSFARKFTPISCGDLATKLMAHLAEKSSLPPYKYETLKDQCDCLIAGCTYSKSLDALYRYIEDIFSDSNGEITKVLTLSSVHKSKGLEWPAVYILGANLWMPSSLAKTAKAIQQEQNLIYVARTRAMEVLTNVIMEDKK